MCYRCSGRDTDRKESQLQPRRTCKLLSMGWRRCCSTSSIYGRSLVLLWLLFAQGRCWTARNAAITPRRPACGPRSLCCFMPVPSESCHASGSIMTKRGRTTLRRASISYVTNEPMSSSGTARDGRGAEEGHPSQASSPVSPAGPPAPPAEAAESSIEYVAECALPTDRGQYRIRSYRCLGANEKLEPLAVVYGPINQDNVLVRVHDQCITSEVFGSKRCDCKEQLEMALDEIRKEGGVVIYLQQEGRGIGLANKIAAYSLQDQGLDTVDANRHLGFDDDERSYDVIPYVLKDLGIKSIQLMTNNPMKVRHLKAFGVVISGVRPIIVAPNTFNQQYLKTKVERMEHILPSTSSAADVGVAQMVPRKRVANKRSKTAGQHSSAMAAAIDQLKGGEPVLVVDKDGRGSAVIAGSRVEARHLIALSGFTRASPRVVLSSSRMAELSGLMEGGSGGGVDFLPDGHEASHTTMSSAQQQALSVRALASPEISAGGRFVGPGHIFPFGLDKRVPPSVNRWEAALRLVELAGTGPAAALVMDLEDRQTLRSLTLEEVEGLARTQSYPIAYVADVSM